MLLLNLAYKSLRNRRLTTGLTVFSIALSVGLLIGVEQVRNGVRESFSNTISQTDLIVGPRSGSIQLLLYSVFGMGSPISNIRYETYQKFSQHPAVDWTVPYSLGDSHRGFRVIGTTADFFQRYRYRRDRSIEFQQGRPPEGVFDVVLGHDVAEQLQYRLGDPVAVTHGIAEGFLKHDDKPFKVVGILDKTATPVDRALYILLQGMSAIHIDWKDGAPPMPGQATPAAEIGMDVPIEQITAFFLGAKSRIDTLRLQREINTNEEEPLLAIIPGVALGELWRGIGYAEDGLKIITFFVVAVGLMGMLVSVYTSLNERRREMAILRAVGSGPSRVVSLLVLESGLLSLAGCILGTGLIYMGLFIAQPMVERHFGLYVPIQALSWLEYAYLAAVVAAGFAIGLAPALKAYRNTLADGLSVRV